MFDRILVPLDGSELAARVVWQVERLLRAEDAKVTLLCVVDPHEMSEREREANLEGGERHLSLRVEAAHRDFARLREDLVSRGIDAEERVVLGDPASVIVSEAQRLDQNLIAMATHGRSGPSRWLRGSVAERVLRQATTPLLLCNPTSVSSAEGAHRFRTVLVPLDGSERSAAILPLVQDLARRFGSRVVLLRVGRIVTAPVDYPLPELARAPTEEALRADLETHRASLERAGVEVACEVAFDSSEASAILDAVERYGADLVAMTTHGWTGLDRWLFGSVAEKVLRRCEAPLLVMRVAALAAAEEPAVAAETQGASPA